MMVDRPLFLLMWADGTGLQMGDAALTVLLVVASVASCWNIAQRGHSIPGWLLLVGFTTIAMRMVHALIVGLDPLIPPVSLISLAMISSGWSLLAFRSRSRSQHKMAPA